MGILRCFSSFMAICSGSVSPSSSTITGAHIAICSARVPNTRARSYFVMYRVVILFDFWTTPRASPADRMSIFSPSSCHTRQQTLETFSPLKSGYEVTQRSHEVFITETCLRMLIPVSKHNHHSHRDEGPLNVEVGGSQLQSIPWAAAWTTAPHPPAFHSHMQIGHFL